MNADVNIALTRTQRQFTRFAAVGFASNVVLYGVYLSLTALSLRPHAAMTITYAAAVLIAYLLNQNWTFRYPGTKRAAFVRYVVAYGLAYATNFLGLSVLVDWLEFPHEGVQAGLILFLAMSLFLAQKFWVFDHAAVESGTE